MGFAVAVVVVVFVFRNRKVYNVFPKSNFMEDGFTKSGPCKAITITITLFLRALGILNIPTVND